MNRANIKDLDFRPPQASNLYGTTSFRTVLGNQWTHCLFVFLHSIHRCTSSPYQFVLVNMNRVSTRVASSFASLWLSSSLNRFGGLCAPIIAANTTTFNPSAPVFVAARLFLSASTAVCLQPIEPWGKQRV
jgi:hypothetical protein